MNEMFDPGKVKAILEKTLSAVLAEMTFLDCMPHQNPDPQILSSMKHCVAIDVLKPSPLRIEIRVGEMFRKRIISMLFDASEEPEKLSSEDDILLEILNVVTGNFLTQYFGMDQLSTIELPRYLYNCDPTEGCIVVESVMDVEGEYVQIILRSIR